MRQACARFAPHGAPGVRQVCARCAPGVRQAAGHMRNRSSVINFGIATAVVSVGGGTSRNKQETDGSRHSTAPSGAQNALCGLDFRKARQILLRLRFKKISSIEAKEPKLWMFEEGQSTSSLESRQAWTRPEPPKRLILLSSSGDFNGSARLQKFFSTRDAGRFE